MLPRKIRNFGIAALALAIPATTAMADGPKRGSFEKRVGHFLEGVVKPATRPLMNVVHPAIFRLAGNEKAARAHEIYEPCRYMVMNPGEIETERAGELFGRGALALLSPGATVKDAAVAMGMHFAGQKVFEAMPKNAQRAAAGALVALNTFKEPLPSGILGTITMGERADTINWIFDSPRHPTWRECIGAARYFKAERARGAEQFKRVFDVQ
jgi:hypothetical protein